MNRRDRLREHQKDLLVWWRAAGALVVLAEEGELCSSLVVGLDLDLLVDLEDLHLWLGRGERRKDHSRMDPYQARIKIWYRGMNISEEFSIKWIHF